MCSTNCFSKKIYHIIFFQDELTLIDEDPDQPEICQIWFEIKTSKTCNREPNISLDVPAKDLMNENKQVTI